MGVPSFLQIVNQWKEQLKLHRVDLPEIFSSAKSLLASPLKNIQKKLKRKLNANRKKT
jgi:hypothetical protein